MLYFMRDHAAMALDRRCRDIVENASDLILAVDLDDRITSVNAAFERTLGYARVDVIGLPLASIVAPEWRGQLRDATAVKLRWFQPTVYDLELVANDGATVSVEVSSWLIVDDDGPVGVQAVCRDVTESNQRFRRLFESSPQGMAVVDQEGRVLEANPALGRTLGYGIDELTGLGFTEFTHPDDCAVDVEQYTKLMAGELSHYELEKRFIRKDGELVWGHITVFALPDPGARPRLAIGILGDITERRALEEQLRQSQRMEAIGQLAGGVAHDFNNLLAAVTSYCDLAEDALPERGDATVRASLEGIRGAADRAAEVTQQLLAFGRRQVLELRAIDLNAAVTDQMRLLRRLLGEDIEVRLVLEPELVPVTMDPGQLTQVVMNLAVNARDAMPGGGILTIETHNVDLDRAPTTTGIVSGPHVLLAVTDTGSGMEESTRVRAFEPFFTTKEPGKGTGLGLSTVLGIVEQSGGRVSVYSEPGLGTTFKVYMRSAARSTAETAPAPAATHARPSGSGTILLVEDNDAVRRPVARLLAELGYDVVPAEGPDQALALADGRALDLVLTDVVMPKMNGRQLAERLVASRPSLKVLYMSGYTDDAVIARGVIEPGTAFLQKPFGVDRLAQKIRELLDA
jgi:two-component system, cell cycle sensor histidine kinase and response regulator CckA